MRVWGASNALDHSGDQCFLSVMVYSEQAEVHIFDDEAASRVYIEQLWAGKHDYLLKWRF